MDLHETPSITGETPGGTKRKKDTPTPVNQRPDGTLTKRGRGEPIPMENTAEPQEPQVGNRVELPKKTYAQIAMEKAQEEAMKVAPPMGEGNSLSASFRH